MRRRRSSTNFSEAWPSPHPEERRVSKDKTTVGAFMVRDGADAPPHHEGLAAGASADLLQALRVARTVALVGARRTRCPLRLFGIEGADHPRGRADDQRVRRKL